MIRPFRSETERYGEYSKAGEFVYDHPFLWGSKRTGPDLHRLGGKYLHSWHYRHMYDPTLTSEGSLMPRYQWLYWQKIDKETTPDKIAAMRTLGVPYEESYEYQSIAVLERQAEEIVKQLVEQDGDISKQPPDHDLDIIALIAYLQRLGTDIKVEGDVSMNETGN